MNRTPLSYTLFDTPTHPPDEASDHVAPYRSTDPSTSAQAARRHGPKSASIAVRVLAALRAAGVRGLMDEEGERALSIRTSAYRGRRNELVVAGYARAAADARGKPITGRNSLGGKSIFWVATDKPGDGSDAPALYRKLVNERTT